MSDGKWSHGRGRHGQTLQASMPKQRLSVRGLRMADRPFRAAVFAVRSGNRAASSFVDREDVRGVFVDVYLYGRQPGPLHNVRVPQGPGVHDGDIWIPRPTSGVIPTGDQAFLDYPNTDPETWDGDHVLVDFVEGDESLPYIRGIWTHPQIDASVSAEAELGAKRLLIGAEDGSPRISRHHGIAWGVTALGDWLLDARNANSGEPQADGSETEQAEAKGSFLARLGAGARFFVTEGLAALLEGSGSGATARLTIGDGAKHAAQVEELRALYTTLHAKLVASDGHIHPLVAVTATMPSPAGPVPLPLVGTMGPPSPLIEPPAWDPGIESDKLAFPDRDA